MLGDAGDQRLEVVPGESPVEGRGDLVVVVLERVKTVDDRLQAFEVVGGQHLALDDREDQLDLAQPGGMEWEVDEDEVGPPTLEAVDRGLPRYEEPLSTIQNTRLAWA